MSATLVTSAILVGRRSKVLSAAKAIASNDLLVTVAWYFGASAAKSVICFAWSHPDREKERRENGRPTDIV